LIVADASRGTNVLSSWFKPLVPGSGASEKDGSVPARRGIAARKAGSKEEEKSGMIADMAKLLRAILGMSLPVISLAGNSLASSQSQTQTQTQAQTAQPPARALANLYEVAKSIINKPSGEAEEHPGGSPTFPYPDAIQLQWDQSMALYGNKLNPQEQALFPPCATHLNNAIADTEKGYTTEDTQPKSNTGAQADAQKSYAAGKLEFEQCDAAYALAQSEVGNGAANKPQQGGADTNANPEPTPAPAENPPAGTPETPTSDTSTPPTTASNGAIPGSVEESEEPGSIDWTPTLDPLFTYLSKEWNLVASDPRNNTWAADDAGNTLTLKLQPNQAPEVESISGARSSSLRTITENGLPETRFPNGSKLNSVVVAPTFSVKPKAGMKRTRMKYYERNGIFKSYSVAQ
jgi:hypothetical protein